MIISYLQYFVNNTPFSLIYYLNFYRYRLSFILWPDFDNHLAPAESRAIRPRRTRANSAAIFVKVPEAVDSDKAKAGNKPTPSCAAQATPPKEGIFHSPSNQLTNQLINRVML